ncbi:YitT family protein [Scopulibacillus cellulosilyticus]|uniref:YitT family protein n=1 Tax=Scopulibacillus cellulosilyticus TaxID=2665665 RepID=A0ABW2PXA3_9BACL
MIEKFLSMIMGSILLSIGIDGFLVPNHLLDGGIIGIGLILKYIWGFKVGLTIIILSLPIYIFAWFYKRSVFYNGLHGLLISSFFMDLFSPLNSLFHIPIYFDAVIGGCLVGIGVGLMLRKQCSTGGLDLLSQFIAEKLSINVGGVIFIFDGIILLTGHKTIGVNFFYSAVVVLLVALMTVCLTMGATFDKDNAF